MSIIAKTAVPTRNRLLSSCAIAAIATLGWQAPAQAQLADGGFQGAGIAVGGKATITTPDALSTLVTINAPRAIIDWQPNSGVDFLPQDRTATFVNSAASQLSDFTVLNRINSDQPVALNGHVISRLQDAAQNMSRGGRVWFSAPGGIIVGANSTFDVGSLLLATGAARTTGTGDAEDFDALNTRFRNAPDSQAKIDIKPGAQINASSDGRAPTFANPGSYVALIAPRIRQGGTVNVDGSAGYAAGEDVEMRIFNNGLFGFTVFSGSSIGRTEANPNGDPVTFVHDGTTTGPGATAEFESDPQEMFMIAVPKNDAVTMLLQGTIGYAPAAAAFQREDRITLSASQGTVDGVNNDVTADLVMTSVTATSDAIAGATGDLTITRGSFEQLLTGATNSTVLGGNYDGFVEIFASNTARVTANAENPLTSTDQFNVIGGRSATFEAIGGGRATIGGGLLVDASSRFGESLGVGGTATLRANDGTVQIAGAATVAADGRGFTSEESDGTGRGGTARVEAIRGETGYGSIGTGGGLQASANGFGAEGSSGFGGAVVIEAQGGSIAAPSISAFADGIGGFSFESGYGGVSLPFGDGEGGSVTVTTSDAFPNQELSQGTIDTDSLIQLYARGLGGRTNSCEGFCERFSVAQLGELSNTGTGGAGVGGLVTLTVSSGVVDANTLIVDVRGAGGRGSSDSERLNGDGSPGEGGTAKLIFDGGRGAFSSIDVNAQGTGGEAGFGGADGRGGDALGGVIELSTSNGGAIRAESESEGMTFPSSTQINLSANAVAGDGEEGQEVGYGQSNAAGGGFGGNAQGGRIAIDFNGGTSFISQLGANVEGSGGQGGDGFASGFDDDEDNSPLDARDGGDAGFGRGGSIRLDVDGGTLSADLFLGAEGESDNGGDSAFRSGGRGGDTRGGLVTVRALGSGNITGNLDIRVSSRADDGGRANGARGGDGGNAERGSLNLIAEAGGQIILGQSFNQFQADAEAGDGGDWDGGGSTATLGGNGGSAQAATVTFRAEGNDGEEASRISLGSLFINAQAEGGDGGEALGDSGNGGNATGGRFVISTADSGEIQASSLSLRGAGFAGFGGDSEFGEGGDGGTGGAAQGGSALLTFDGGTSNLGFVDIELEGFAGDGGEVFGQSDGAGGSGGDGGVGRGGNFAMRINLGSTVNLGAADILTTGEGGSGGFGNIGRNGGAGGDGGQGGDGFGGAISLTVDGGALTMFGGEGGFDFESEGIGGRGGRGGDAEFRLNTYRFVEAGLTWEEALAAAALEELNGVQGHLVTITSFSENFRVAGVIGNAEGFSAWAAASDDGEGNENNFTWRAGPENGRAVPFAPQTFPWARAGGENPEPIGGTNENFLEVGTDGSWNDLDGMSRRDYVVEFETALAAGSGGRGGDGGFAQGGAIAIRVSDSGIANIDSIGIEADASGGDGGFGGLGGGVPDPLPPVGESRAASGGGGDAQGGSALIEATTGGTINAREDGYGSFFSGIEIDVDAQGGFGGGLFGGEGGGFNDFSSFGGNATGGNATLRAAGGVIDVSGDIEFDVGARAGDGGAQGGNALGGTAAIEADGLVAGESPSPSRILVSGNVTLSANAGTSQNFFSFSGAGGTGTGGTARIDATGGSLIDIDGGVLLDASGAGGIGGFAGGDGFGGVASILASGSDIEIGGDLDLNAMSFGGFSFFEGGYGDGGGNDIARNGVARIDILSPDGRVGRLSLDTGEGLGSIRLNAVGTGAGSNGGCFPFCGGVAAAKGGEADGGFAAAAAAAGGGGGDGFGGTAEVIVDGILEVRTLALDVQGYGSRAGSASSGLPGGDGQGGIATVDFRGNENSLDRLDILASGFGGEGGTGSGRSVNGTVGGSGFGGTAQLLANGGTVQVDDIDIRANGQGGRGGRGSVFDSGYGEGAGEVLIGSGARGGDGRGGIALVDAGFGGIITLPAIELEAIGRGGEGGRGGDNFNQGNGGTGGRGGDGLGGTAELRTSGGTLEARTTTEDVFDDGYGTVIVTREFGPDLEAEGFGGQGGDGGRGSGLAHIGGAGGNGGDGTGGTALANAVSGTLDAGPTDFFAGGFGGEGGQGGYGNSDASGGQGGRGGNGIGGTAEMRTGGGSLSIFGEDVTEDGYGTFVEVRGAILDTDSFGGEGGHGGFAGNGTGLGAPGLGGGGGDGTGGHALANVVGGSLGTGPAEFLASGFGGSGGVSAGDLPGGLAGSGFGGTAEIRIADGEGGNPGSASLGDTEMVASGITGFFGSNRGTETSGSVIIASNAAADGALTISDLFAESRGDNVSDHLGFALTVSGGAINVTDEVNVEVDQNAAFTGFGAGRLVAEGDVVVDANDSILLSQDNQSVFLITGNDVELEAGNSILGETGSLRAEFDIDLTAGEFIDVGRLDADFNIDAFAGRDVSVGSGRAGFNINLEAGNSVFAGSLDAGFNIDAEAGTDITIASIVAGFNVGADAGRDVRITDITAGFNIDIEAGLSVVSTGTFDGSRIDVFAGLDASLATARARSDIDIFAGRSLRLDNGTGQTINLTAGNSQIDSAGLLTATQLNAVAGTNIALNDVDVILSLSLTTPNGFVSGHDFTSAGDITIDARDGITLASGLAGDDLVGTSSGGSIVIGSARVVGQGLDNEAEEGPDERRGNVILLDAANDVRLDNGALADGSAATRIGLTARSGRIDSGGLLRATRLDASAGTNIALTDVIVADSLILAAANGFVTGRNFRSDGDIMVDAAGLIGLASGMAGGDILLDSALGIISAPAGSGLRLDAGGSVTAIGTIGVDLDLDINAGDSITIGDADAGRDIDLDAIVSVLAGNLTAASNVDVDTRQDTNIASIAAGSSVELAARGSINVGSIEAVSNIDADAGGDIGITTAMAGALIDFNASGSVTSVGLLDAGTTLDAFAGSDITINVARAGDDIELFAVNAVTLANGTAGRDILIDAGGQIRVTGVAQAGDDFIANSFEGSFAGATVRTTGLGEDVDESGYGTGDGSNIFVDAAGAIRLDNGRAADLIDLNAMGGAIDSAGLLAATQLNASAATNIALTDVDVINSLILTTPNGLVSGRNFLSGGGITIDARDGITLASGTAGRDLTLRTDRDIEIGFGQAGDDFDARSELGSFRGGTVRSTGLGPDSDAAGTSRAGSNIFVRAVTGLSLADGSSAFDMNLNADRVSSSGTLAAASAVRISSRLDTSVNRVSAGDTIGLNGQIGTISASSLDAGNSVSASANGDIAITEARAGNGIAINTNAGGSIRLDSGEAGATIFLNARGGGIDSDDLLVAARLDARATTDIALNDVTVEEDLILNSSGGSISGGTFDSDGSITLLARDDVTLRGGARAGSFFDAESGVFAGEGNGFGDVAVGTVGAGTFISLTANGGDLSATSLVAGDGISGFATGDATIGAADAGASFALSAGGNARADTAVADQDIRIDGAAVTLGNGIAARDILLDAAGAIGVGSATAGDDFIATSSGGAVTAQTVVTTGLGEDSGENGYGENGYGGGDGSNIFINSVGDIALNTGTAINHIGLFSETGSIASSTALTAGDEIEVDAGGGITLADATATDGEINLEAGHSVVTGALRSGISTTIESLDGGITVASVTATTAGVVTGEVKGFSAIAGGGDLSVGTASADNIGLAARGGITAGSLSAKDLVLLFADGAISLGSVATDGLFHIGSTETVETLDGFEDFDRAQFDALPHLPSGGAVTITGPVSAGIVDLNAGGALTFASIAALGGADLLAGGNLTGRSVTAGGDIVGRGETIDIRNAATPGQLDLAATADVLIGAADVGSLSATGENITADALIVDASISLATGSGNVTVGSAESGGSIALSASNGTVSATTLEAAGSVLASAGGATSLGTVRAGDEIAISGASVALTDGIAGSDIDLDSPGAINVGFAQAGDDFVATAGTTFTAATVITTGTSQDGDGESGYGSQTAAAIDSDGSNITVDAGGAIALADGNAHDAMRLTSAGGAVSSGTRLVAGTDLDAAAATTITLARADAGDDIDLESGGAIDAARLVAGGDVSLASTGGAVTVATDLQSGGNVDASGTAVTLNAVGPLSVRTASASAGNVGLTSGGNLNVGSAQATGNVAATSTGGTLGLTGDINGVQLAFSSRDIAIGQNARVGTNARTTGIDITANGGAVTIGGTGTSSRYRLDNAEFGRLASRDINIRNQSETSGVQVEALNVRGASATSPNLTGRLTIASSGNVDMVGRLSVDTAGSANSVRVTAGNAFYANTAGAGIAIANGNALTGSIDVEARAITVASQSAVTDLAGASTIAARDERLGRNDGADDRPGYLRAGGIRLAASQRIHVQNSGLNEDTPDPANLTGTSNDNRGGLTAGSSGITLVTLGQAPVEIIINGREENGTGGFVTGASLIPALTLQNGQGGAASFAAGSTVNGCLIGGTTCGFQFEPIVVVQDLLEDLLDDSEDSITRPPLLAFGQLISVEGSPLLPVIDEPVTGTGDDAIWMPTDVPGFECDDERQDCVIDQPVTGSGNEELQRGTNDGTPATTIERGPQDRTIDAPVTGTGNEDNGESE